MRWFLAIVLAAGIGCANHDPRPKADDIVCLCKGDLGCVCVRVDEKTPKSEYKGEVYYFCGQSCKVEFDKDPEKWVQAFRKLQK